MLAFVYPDSIEAYSPGPLMKTSAVVTLLHLYRFILQDVIWTLNTNIANIISMKR